MTGNSGLPKRLLRSLPPSLRKLAELPGGVDALLTMHAAAKMQLVLADAVLEHGKVSKVVPSMSTHNAEDGELPERQAVRGRRNKALEHSAYALAGAAG